MFLVAAVGFNKVVTLRGMLLLNMVSQNCATYITFAIDLGILP